MRKAVAVAKNATLIALIAAGFIQLSARTATETLRGSLVVVRRVASTRPAQVLPKYAVRLVPRSPYPAEAASTAH